jgi:hypothetical protein
MTLKAPYIDPFYIDVNPDLLKEINTQMERAMEVSKIPLDNYKSFPLRHTAI